MQNFVNTFAKAVVNVAEVPQVVLKLNRKTSLKSSKTNNYGGFTADDWKKVGMDMKRGLINFGQSK